MRIEERIENLEKENQLLKLVLSMLLAGVVGTALVALIAGNVPGTVALLLTAGAVLAVMERRQASSPEVIRAQKFEVVGADGVTLVALGETVEGAGAVATYDAEGHFVAALESNPRRVTGRAPVIATDSYTSAVAHTVPVMRASQR